MAYTTINKPTEHFNTKLYTGDGSTSSGITGVGFQPDLLWVKARSQAYDHMLFDRVRQGAAAQPFDIRSNNNSGQSTSTSNVKSFDSDGFTLNNGSYVNGNGVTFASWNWKANGAGVANTDGSISSTVSANTTSGFSIVSYSGTSSNGTIGHELNSAPKMVIVKALASGRDWMTYHKSVGATKYLFLNATDASASSSGIWNDTDPTSTVVHLGSSNSVNGNGINYIAYCFAEKQGYSKFGSYVGNGSADGTFVYTGFKPAFVLWKRTEDAGYDWDLYDTARDTHNVAFKELIPNGSGAESSSTVLSLDILSNGFKLRTSNGNGNDSGKPYIYMAFAEQPLVGDNPATAR